MYYNRFRYYDPSTGNYISQDPIGLAGGMGLYLYVHDPNSWVDVFGLKKIFATFSMGGHTFTGINPTDRVPRVEGVNNVEGLRAINKSTFDMHAEIEAMTKAKSAGFTGGTGVLVVRGENICPYCKGDVKTMARDLELKKLVIVDADGKVHSFEGSELNIVKKGGKGFSCKT